MGKEKEIKKETDWLGREKEVIYEDGKKVGETRVETGLFGGEKKITYDTSGEKVSETRREQGLWDVLSGTEREVTRDTSGRKLSETRHEKGIFGDRKDVIYEGDRKIGELRREDGILDTIFGIKRKVLHETASYDVDLTRRASREESTGASYERPAEAEETKYGECPKCFGSTYDPNFLECIGCGYSEKQREDKEDEGDDTPESHSESMGSHFYPESSDFYKAVNDESPDDKIAAVNRMEEGDEHLNYIAMNDPNPVVRRAAVSRMYDGEWDLNLIARFDKDPDVRREALRKLGKPPTSGHPQDYMFFSNK